MGRIERRVMRPRGMALIELLGIVLLLGVAITLAGHVLVESMRATRQANRDLSEAQRYDVIVTQLRRDVWNARAMETREGLPLVITLEGKRKIIWTRDDQGTLTRTAEGSGEGPRNWASAPAMVFAAQGAMLRVKIAGGAENVELELPSQVMAAEKKQ